MKSIKPVLLATALYISALALHAFTSCKKDHQSATNPANPPNTSIDLTANRQVIRGFGAATVFRPTVPLTTDELDKLFGSSAGQVGLSILRIRVASDDDMAWRALELANAKGAKQRGAIVIATPWSPPARMKSNNNINGGSLLTDSFPNYATYLNSFANYMSANGAELYGISVQNEPDISVTYESCDWNAGQVFNFLKNNADAITATKVISPESFRFNHAMYDAVLNDATATANVDIIGGHIYGGGLEDYPLARNKGKELWMTEHLDTLTTWTSLMGTAKEIHECMVTGNFSTYIWWYAKRFYGPVGEAGDVTKRGYIMSNFARFIRPGYNRVNTTTDVSQNAIYISAYKGTNIVVVAVNAGNSASLQKFSFQNGTATSMTAYTTSETQNLVAGLALPVSGNTFSYSLPAQSVTTFVVN
jgi:glucuronoarabinoxylan endo-1,4-beta-xylanase